MIRLLLALGAISACSIAGAAVLWDQPYDGASEAALSQTMSDAPTLSTYEFDDFEVGSLGWRIAQIRIRGREGISPPGDPTHNVTVRFRIQSAANAVFPGTVFAQFDSASSYEGPDLLFGGLDIELAPGTYWLTASVDRPLVPGGQWFWLRTAATQNGLEHRFHNPGGGFGFGTDPIPGSTVFGDAGDLSFRIEGAIVPEPTAFAGLMLGVGWIVRRRAR